jgi:thymidine kinase
MKKEKHHRASLMMLSDTVAKLSVVCQQSEKPTAMLQIMNTTATAVPPAHMPLRKQRITASFSACRSILQ